MIVNGVSLGDVAVEHRVEVEDGCEYHRAVIVVFTRVAGSSKLSSAMTVTAGWFFAREEALRKTLALLAEKLDPEMFVKMLSLRVADMRVSPGESTYLDRLEKDE